MREALAALTVRGRAFLAAGITTVVAAIVVGHSSVVRIGVLVAALPLLTAWWVGRSRYRLALVRTLSPQLVVAGQPATVELTVSNESRTPTGVLLLEERLPYVLGTRPRFVLEGLGHGWRRHATYQVRSELRGQFEIGPMSVRVTDPFGLVELGRTFHATTRLTVTPRTTVLPSIPLGGAWTGSGDNRPRAFATGSAEDVTVREYRRGDDLRRVHWRSSARVGELMVRREEQPWQSRATVFLDNRGTSHRGQGAASSLEGAVSAAASIAVHLTHHGYTVRLVTASGDSRETTWHSQTAEASTVPLLEALAVVQLDHSPRPTPSGWPSRATAAWSSASSAASASRTCPFLRRLQHHASSSLAIALDVDAWAPHLPVQPGPGSAAHLTSTGWRSITARPARPARHRVAGARPDAEPRHRVGRSGAMKASWSSLPHQLRVAGHRDARRLGHGAVVAGADRRLRRGRLPAAVHRRRARRRSARSPAGAACPCLAILAGQLVLGGLLVLGTTTGSPLPTPGQRRRAPRRRRATPSTPRATTPPRSRSACLPCTRCCSSAARSSSCSSTSSPAPCAARRWPGSCCWRRTPCRSR